MIHCPWDYGTTRSIAGEILGHMPAQKTCKTLCGKRVRLKQIDNAAFDCPDCRRLFEADPLSEAEVRAFSRPQHPSS